MILTPRVRDAQWIDTLGPEGAPACVLPTVEGEQTIVCGGKKHRALVRVLAAPVDSGSDPEARPVEPVFVSPRSAGAVPIRASYLIRPSEVDGGAVQAIVVEQVDLGPRIAFTGSPDMERLGEVFHRFLAADRGPDGEVRVKLARSILRGWRINEVTPAQLLEASDRLRSFVTSRWPDARWRREWPRLGEQRARGRVDLLLEMPDGSVIIDHKSFPGRPELWNDHALGYAPQLFLYADLVRAAGREVAEAWVHLPVVGRALRLF